VSAQLALTNQTDNDTHTCISELCQLQQETTNSRQENHETSKPTEQ